MTRDYAIEKIAVITKLPPEVERVFREYGVMNLFYTILSSWEDRKIRNLYKVLEKFDKTVKEYL